MPNPGDARNVDESALSAEERAAYQELLADYKAATVLVPGYTGGISRKIAVALIQAGWRKTGS